MTIFTNKFNEVPRGLYKIHWKKENPTLGAVGEFSDGTRWLVEADKIFPEGVALGVIGGVMHKIVKMELLHEVEEFDLKAFNKEK
jgi:hypothetical protein